VAPNRSPAMTEALELLAPGKMLRDGIDRILLAKRGALVVVGDGPHVLSICTGGFLLDSEFTPQRMSELAKMDGAIVLTRDASRIARANVHLMPDQRVATTETGTRHRTAERVARSIDVPTISVSAAMSIVTVYRHTSKHVLHSTSWLIDRASQAMQAVERFKHRMDLAMASLSGLEVEDSVTIRDVAGTIQPVEMVGRIAEEVEDYLAELGDDGRLLRLQLGELLDGVDIDRRLLIRDYRAGDEDTDKVCQDLGALAPEDLLDLRVLAKTLGLPSDLDQPIEPRGYRMLHRVPRFPEPLIERIVDRFGTLQGIMRATTGDLEKVGGVGTSRARSVKDGLARLTEVSILDRYT